MAVPCTIIMAATVLTALMPPIYCLEETREPSRDPHRHGENMETPRRDLPIVNSSSFPLNMAPDAVDDMYYGCTEEMKKKVKTKYFKKENKGIFQKAWKAAKKCSTKKKDPEDKALTKDHMLAICAYTAEFNSGYKNNENDKKLYDEFNKAVRTGRSNYSSTFPYHSLHFWLTTAIQTLNSNYHCHTTYRRTNVTFTGNVNDIIRFGAFASSSKRTNLTQFGNKTCFEIETCSGAYLKNYSKHPREEEVLIPPYETFKITNITEGQGDPQGLNDCEKVFILESAGGKSNLNCKLAHK
ncbi:erythroblast NAD(P)(+)--arginine ADP-ribosyltransferase-like isoform X2 [Thunnus maccoyii]|uniref:erythroblast NAD(P)(+)--arginine ADP-ribosyltransferase-like isoform X2 n=1 Tax=Thunnus maccoyii TaxID=8240 RepID=UPI001C4C365E|nr:erythroblast NAD(P)(+)--arginine ADP-ribosyltransferase-like isoform X2 [Thunnus maccoyii]